MSRSVPKIRRRVTAPRIVRNTPGNAGRETDRAASAGSAELMRGLLTIIDFDLNVQYHQRQPVVVEYTGPLGARSAFTPEFLITYRRDIEPACRMKPLLCDVMTREDVYKNWADILPRIRAAHRYARWRGWKYQMLTEREIKTPYLVNARFLLPYCRLETDWEHARPLLDKLYELRQADPEALLAACAKTEAHRAKLAISLWQMIARWRIGADLTELLTMRSTIWSRD